MRFQRNSCSKCFFPIGMKGKITGKSCRPNYMHKHETLPSCRTPSFYSGKRDQTDQPNGGSIAQHRFYTACYIENCKDFFPADSLANSEPICNQLYPLRFFTNLLNIQNILLGTVPKIFVPSSKSWCQWVSHHLPNSSNGEESNSLKQLTLIFLCMHLNKT